LKIRKAVITAAGRGVRLYPVADTVQKAMLPLVDRDGLAKPLVQIIAEEAIESGIEEICIVCAPGDEQQYLKQLRLLQQNLLNSRQGADWAQQQAAKLDSLTRRLSFAVQKEPLGYGHAVHCAREFVGNEPFLLLLDDHLYISSLTNTRCAAQLIGLAEQGDSAVSAVQATREHLVGYYGTVSGKRVPDVPGVYQIERIIEKPSVSMAETLLQTPGLRAAYYLCFFGMHVLPHRIFDILEDAVHRHSKSALSGSEVQLTPALQELACREKCLAIEVAGARYDISARFGLMQTQVALGMAGSDRDSVLRTIIELLAEAHCPAAADAVQ
jgi:UTP--glucose-1-phosphate uridylyltransferase